MSSRQSEATRDLSMFVVMRFLATLEMTLTVMDIILSFLSLYCAKAFLKVLHQASHCLVNHLVVESLVVIL